MASTTTSAATDAAQDGDYLFLTDAFGCGVQDCIDQTKETKAATKKIEERIGQAKTLSTAEQNTAYQYGKDYGHLEDEMKRHWQVMKDQLSEADMKEHMRKQLSHSFAAEFSTIKNGPKDDEHHSMDQGESTEQDFLTQQQQEFERLYKSIRTTAKELNSLKAQEHSLMEQRTKVHTQMNAENLVGKLETSKETVAKLTKELAEEEQREKTIRAAINEVRSKTGAHAAGYVEKTTLRADNQTMHADEEAKFKEEVEVAKKEAAAEVEKRDALKIEMETKTKAVDDIKAQIVGFQKLREERNTLIDKTNQFETQIAILDSDLKEKRDGLAKKKDAATKASEGLENAKGDLEQAQARRSKNDEGAAKMKDDQKAIDDLQKEKEVLANSLKESEKSLSPEAEADFLQVKTRQGEIDQLDQEMKAHEERLARLVEDWETKQRTKKENRESFETQLSETEQYKHNFEKATELEKTRLEESKKEWSETLESTIAETKKENQTLRDTVDIKAVILEEGADALKKADGAECKVRAKEEKVEAL